MRHGFTLLELLLATMLSTVLMIGVLAVVSDLGASGLGAGDALAKSADAGGESGAAVDQAALEAWVRLLRDDLAHAGYVDVAQENAVTLVGLAALEGPGRRLTHRPVRVEYRVEMVKERAWVVRRQESLDVLTNQSVQRDLACGGVRRFVLERGSLDSKGDVWRLKAWAGDGAAPTWDHRVMLARRATP